MVSSLVVLSPLHKVLLIESLSTLLLSQRSSQPSISLFLDINSDSYGLFLRKLIYSGHPHFSEKLYTVTIMGRGILPNSSIINSMIICYCKLGKFDETIDHLNQLYRIRCSLPNHVMFLSLIKRNMPEKGYYYLKCMLDDGFDPDVVLYTMLIHQFCRKGDIPFALSLYDLMGKKDIDPNLITFGSLISGVCRNLNGISFARRDNLDRKWSGRAKGELAFLLSKMPINHYQGPLWWSSVEMFERAWKLIQDAKEKGLSPDLHLHNAIMNGYCRLGRIRDAYKHLESMPEEGLVPNQVSYTILVDGCIRVGETDKAIEVFNKMHSRGCVPDRVTYNALLKGLCQSRRVLDASSFMRP